ncbi:UDP-N-acetylmuramoyl-tripeptide--D-alanyl-D-alanine ligase [Negadavirga shengliensis]|uniref:UDP-N-acetylmuramoyl-tripeptide--D-alanyl-D-alanine ligase n=1 Tax=Negadavirga shengliensis TaxID=1389218 RepID=A0ABV9SVC5_9BACT
MNSTEKLYQHYLLSTGVSTDTRKIGTWNIFFALKGPNFNGNRFAAQALESGAALVVMDEAPEIADDRYFIVENVLKTLQELATFHREKHAIPVLGLTGSNGKTTSKELISAVLGKKYRVLATKGNLNNHIGVPLTLLELEKNHEIAIIEMGANKQGEIRELCEIARPTHGFITNIGKAHLEGMGGLEGVLKTKTELFQYLLERDGKVFINTRQKVFSNMAKRFKDPVLFPEAGSFCHVGFEGADPFVKFNVDGQKTRQTNLIGAYNFDNLAAALCIGKYFGVSMEDSLDAVVDYKSSNMRSQLVEKRTNLILLDAYNANPSSMEAALKAFDAMGGRKHKMVILGDMLELGDHAAEEHEKLGALLKGMDVDKICLTGTLIQAALTQVPNALYFPDPFSFRNWLQDSKLEDYLILIKGSRGMKLEGLLDFI